jgi:adenylate cyclase class IV
MSYECPRCRYTTTVSIDMKRHLNRKNSCKCTYSDMSSHQIMKLLFPKHDDIVARRVHACGLCKKQFTHPNARNRHEIKCTGQIPCSKQRGEFIHDVDLHQQIITLQEQIQMMQCENEKLRLHIQNLTGVRKEQFYQALVEEYLQGTHKRLMYKGKCVGVSDVTTQNVHAEIKHFDNYKEALGQLLWYNCNDQGKELHLYLFGRHPVDKTHVIVDQLINNFDVQVFMFDCTGSYVNIICVNTGDIVFNKHFDM